MAKHTPTPWKHIAMDGGWDGLEAADGTRICHLDYNNPENADFIVLAVNAHDDLVAALAACRRLINEALPKFDWGKSALDANAIFLLNDTPRLVDAALAKAGVISPPRTVLPKAGAS